MLLPRLISQSLPLIPNVVDVLARAEVVVITSSNHDLYLDIDQRSGPPGFVRLDANNEDSCILIYPEYSGIPLYQTLDSGGNIPTATLLFPDLNTGNTVIVTGRKEILAREDAVRVLPRSNIAVKINVESIQYIENGLPFYAVPNLRASIVDGTPSTKRALYEKLLNRQNYARLVDKKRLTPTITRFRFHIVGTEETSRWEPGQYVTLDFEMFLRPQLSSNAKVTDNSYIRKFTISLGVDVLSNYSHFEITIRKVGIATNYLFNHDRGHEILIIGFGGEFIFQQEAQDTIGFLGGGVGITPLLAQIGRLHLSRIRVYWTVKAEDLGLVVDSFERAPALCRCTRLFVTGKINDEASEYLTKLDVMDATVRTRRMVCEDLQLNSDKPNKNVRKWYLCTGAALRKTLLEWLNGRNVIFETFNF